MGRTATARAAGTRRYNGRGSTAGRSRKKLERCEHGLLKGTCAICLQMEETTDLTTGKLAPEERPGRIRGEEDESEEEE